MQGGDGPPRQKESPLIKRIVIAAAAVAALGAAVGPASADPSVCLTTDVTVNGTALPTNGTNCLPPAAE